MTLIDRLEVEVKEAMLARESARRDALRLILSSLKSAEKDLRRPLSEDEEMRLRLRVDVADGHEPFVGVHVVSVRDELAEQTVLRQRESPPP